MGLTIHYQLVTPGDWTPTQIKAKLEQARQFAMTLPVVSVSHLAEFKGKEADFQHIRDTGREEQDDFIWAKIQGQRHIVSPWKPGCFMCQPPNRMDVFSVLPAEGCEEANFGVCSYPRHIWKASEESPPAWSLVFDDRKRYPESQKAMQSFLRRWGLKKLPDSKPNVWRRDRFGGTEKYAYHHPTGYATATIAKGRYLSHRRGYAGAFGLVCLRDRMKHELYLKFNGTAEEADQAFLVPEFQADLNRLVTGGDHVTPATAGTWASSCKTQYANELGWNNFVKAHLSVLAILEYFHGLGFGVEVSDESDFWENRDLGALAKTIGDWDMLLAGMAGAIKDAAAKTGLGAESAMDGRPDFERLEMQAQGQLGDLLKKMQA